jgi:hypothetical protein
MVRLFTNPDEWQQAREEVGVFQFYAVQLGATETCPECGDNVLGRFADVSAFAQLRRWGVAAAVEVGAVKEWGCTAEATLPLAERVLANVGAVGGEIRYVTMDEPLLGGLRCDQAMEDTAAEVVRYASSLRSRSRGLQVGDVEPYPQFDAPQLLEWLDALAQRGFLPAFFHIDVDRPRARLMGRDVPADLAAIRSACAWRAIPFGVIFWGADGVDEEGYANDVLAWVDSVGGAIGRPPHVVFQSWSLSPDGRREVPINLPEHATQTWTHTRLLREGLARLGH